MSKLYLLLLLADGYYLFPSIFSGNFIDLFAYTFGSRIMGYKLYDWKAALYQSMVKNDRAKAETKSFEWFFDCK